MSSRVAEEPDGLEIPYSALSPEALRGVIEEFVTRDGTDYGRAEKLLDQKIADVRRQLERGEAKITFDPETATVNIAPAR